MTATKQSTSMSQLSSLQSEKPPMWPNHSFLAALHACAGYTIPSGTRSCLVSGRSHDCTPCISWKNKNVDKSPGKSRQGRLRTTDRPRQPDYRAGQGSGRVNGRILGQGLLQCERPRFRFPHADAYIAQGRSLCLRPLRRAACWQYRYYTM